MSYYIYNLQLVGSLSELLSNIKSGFICNQFSYESAEKMLKELGASYNNSDYHAYAYLLLIIRLRKERQNKTLVLNLATAYRYYEKTAWFGICDACVIVGNFNLEGKYVPQDYDRAFSYFLQAANAGYSPAYYNVGVCYYFGYGCFKDKEKAKEWWLKGNREGDELCYKALTKYI